MLIPWLQQSWNANIRGERQESGIAGCVQVNIIRSGAERRTYSRPDSVPGGMKIQEVKNIVPVLAKIKDKTQALDLHLTSPIMDKISKVVHQQQNEKQTQPY